MAKNIDNVASTSLQQVSDATVDAEDNSLDSKENQETGDDESKTCTKPCLVMTILIKF